MTNPFARKATLRGHHRLIASRTPGAKPPTWAGLWDSTHRDADVNLRADDFHNLCDAQVAEGTPLLYPGTPIGCVPMQVDTAPQPRDSRIAVIIPHLDKIGETRTCCESLANQSVPPALVMLIDNASTAHTEAELVAACPNALIRRLDTNKGFAGAVNIGIHEALQNKTISHILLLNNDTICPADALEKLLALSESDPANGLTGCPLLEGAGVKKKVIQPGKHLKGPWAIPRYAKEGESPDYFSGTCLLIKRGVLESVGLFDEAFFFYWEDADFCRRAKECGWKLAVASDVLVQHTGSSTARCFSELLANGYRAGHIRYLRKYSRHPLANALPPFVFRLTADILAGHWAAVRGNSKGFIKGWE